ncbi:uncharacterized protein LOC128261426 isoform X1 [Drosophila gunungcola]|uniref:DUF4200 domain-containing protein n=1 Tax=Drosophila gunungcola TaxID=103775 RepID=A0A9Q0BSE5_9MUSC|nr:uncharacterized protein LOC128261426 isoform X1 [Drosophila gunungcola]KAI8042079.1 hypothetical protein M5D96_003379 [Drosophila gunungcola]
MPRVKPTKKLDVLGNLDLRPEDAVGDYISSKQQNKFFVIPPNSDSAGDSIELIFVNNLREHEAMLKLQEEMLTSAKRQSKVNSTRVRNMYKIQERLRRRFIEVNSFIKDCAEKKRAAEKTAQGETLYHKELGEGIESFKEEIGELKAFREALKATVQEFQPYEKVLDEVVKVSSIFVSPKDCIDRCDALMLAQVEINKLEHQKLLEIESMRQRMVQITNEAALTVLGLKNDLARLERSYNESRVQCLRWEKILASTKDAINNSYMDKERTIDAITNLHRILCRRRDIPSSSARGDLVKLLDSIKNEVEILTGVLKEVESSDPAVKLEEVRDVTFC